MEGTLGSHVGLIGGHFELLVVIATIQSVVEVWNYKFGIYSRGGYGS